MLEMFKPDMYKNSIYDIDYKKLKSIGIKCILLDFDNTLIAKGVTRTSKKTKDYIERLKDMGFKVILFSNAGKKKLKPFKEKLEVDCAASAKKPFKHKFKKIIKEFNYEENEIAMIGDQFFTDILGGNRMGIFTVLVEPINKKEMFITKLNRIFEKIVIRRLKRKGLFEKGKFYD